ncbi:hypothetical protein ACWHA1_18795 [Streptomyces decoyicus]
MHDNQPRTSTPDALPEVITHCLRPRPKRGVESATLTAGGAVTAT